MLVDESDSTSIFNFNAKITAVTTSGEANNYIIITTIFSPDKSCEQYLDW